MPVQGAQTPPPRPPRPRPPAVSTDRTIGAQRLSQGPCRVPPATLSRPRRPPRRRLPLSVSSAASPAFSAGPSSQAAERGRQRRHHRRPRLPASQPARNYPTFNDIASRAEAEAADRSTSIGKICSLHQARTGNAREIRLVGAGHATRRQRPGVATSGEEHLLVAPLKRPFTSAARRIPAL
jgi:hypothetical protein